MHKCEICGATFEKPEQLMIGVSENEILLICPNCGDDRTEYLWENQSEEKERRNE